MMQPAERATEESASASSTVPATWSDIVDVGFRQHVEDFRFKVSTRRNKSQWTL